MSAILDSATVTATLAGRVLQGHALHRYFATTDGLRSAGDRIRLAAAELGCTNVMSASESSSGVVAASALLSDGGLVVTSETDIRNGVADRVLLVETVAITGIKVRRVIPRLREAGALWIGVLVLRTANEASEGAIEFPGADAVLVG